MRPSAAGCIVGFIAPGIVAADAATPGFAPNAFIRIDPAGKVTLVMPQVEMGQGVYTSISMILAEELDADWRRVVYEHAPPSDALYGNPAFGLQATGNSNSIRAFWLPLRKAAAGTRAILVQAAAAGWKVDPASCRTEASEVIHDATGRRIGYGALTGRAAELKPPARTWRAWIGTLRNLAAMKAQWHGTVVMIAQPAEERGMGAPGRCSTAGCSRPSPSRSSPSPPTTGAPQPVPARIGVTAGLCPAQMWIRST